MTPAEFEEKEYEAPLYNQLERGNLNVWAPGQVFEGYIGLDRALFTVDDFLFRLHGHQGYLPGAALARYVWPSSWLARRRRARKLPSFRQNLFVQAKRPTWSRRPPLRIRNAGLSGICWRFAIETHQQAALEIVAAKLAKRALVVYAAPAFHRHRDLYLHTRKGTIVRNSTFPSVAVLSGHTGWYYAGPGGLGVANPDVTVIQESPLEDRVASLVAGDTDPVGEGREDGAGWRQSLKALDGSIREALDDETLEETSRRASYFELTTQIDREVAGIEEAAVSAAYLKVAAFCASFALDWYVIGP